LVRPGGAQRAGYWHINYWSGLTLLTGVIEVGWWGYLGLPRGERIGGKEILANFKETLQFAG